MPALQVLALCRFSYPTLAGTGFSGERKPSPYAAERLARRLWIFEKICLPGIRIQTDKRFKVLVLVGHGLPAEVKRRLVELTDEIPEVEICEAADYQTHLEVCSRLIKKHRRHDADYVAELMLDDDDCMCASVIAELHEIFQRTHLLVEKEKRIEIDFCKGYAVKITDGTCRFKEVIAPHWTCGQAIIQKMPCALTVASFHHFRFWRRHVCISSAKETMFARTFHGTNDTGDRWDQIAGIEPLFDRDQLISEFAKRFGIDLRPYSDQPDTLELF